MLPKIYERGKATVFKLENIEGFNEIVYVCFYEQKIFTSSWFVLICIILFWIFLLQNYIFDDPYRLRDIAGNGASFFVILIYISEEYL